MIEDNTSILSGVKVLTTLIGALVTISVAFWNYFTSRKNLMDIEKLKHDLSESKSLKDARREYEFEARKRLYQEYEPLLFQLTETSENALNRVQSLARSSKNIDLENNEGLSKFEYYAISTIYNLFAPLAIFHMMQKNL